jgi:hypothetical protein
VREDDWVLAFLVVLIQLMKKDAFPNELKDGDRQLVSLYIPVMNKLFAACISGKLALNSTVDLNKKIVAGWNSSRFCLLTNMLILFC